MLRSLGLKQMPKPESENEASRIRVFGEFAIASARLFHLRTKTPNMTARAEMSR
jgi:hypothetical protein